MEENNKKYYISAMECWKGREDSDTDYDAFRWHQWVRPLDLSENEEELKPFDGKLGFAFIGFCSEQGYINGRRTACTRACRRKAS